MTTPASSFGIDPAFVSMLTQQPGHQSALVAVLQATQTVCAQQKEALARYDDAGQPVVGLIDQIGLTLSGLRTTAGQWNDQLRDGLVQIVADFQQLVAELDQATDSSATRAVWQRSLATTQTVGKELTRLTSNLTDGYLTLTDRHRALLTLGDTVGRALADNQRQQQQKQADIDALQAQINQINVGEAVADSIFGPGIGTSIGDLLTHKTDRQGELDWLQQKADDQAGVIAGLTASTTAVGQLIGGLQAFESTHTGISNAWISLWADINNFTDALLTRIHPDSPFLAAQVRAAASRLTDVLRLFPLT